MLKEVRARIGVFFSGRYNQFNLFVVTFCILLFVGFRLVQAYLSGTSLIVANLVFGVMFIALFVIAAVYFLRQQPRGNAEGVPVVEADIGSGRMKLINPPDSFYEPQQFNIMLRLFMVGYDENLCPDAEVIGNVADKKFRQLSEEEKRSFRAKHVEEIRLARIRIAQNLSSGTPQPEVVDIPTAD
jgi:hypothetical protein